MRHLVRSSRAMALVAIGTLLTLAACSDSRDASSLTGVRNVLYEHGATIDQQVVALLPQLWPSSQSTTASSLLAWWDTIKQKLARNDMTGAASMLVEVTRLIQHRADKIVPRPGETQAQSAAHLVLLMSLYVHSGPNTPPPDVTPQTEATLALVSPGEEETVQTPSKEGGVTFSEGSVNTPTIVVITRNTDEFPDECSGPLPTSRCQYPAFFKFNVFPDVKLNSPALVGVCREENGERRMPRADHDRFRLAHQKPADPSAYNPAGYIEGEIEILPLQSAVGVVDCPREDGDEGDGGGLASLLRRTFKPKLLYAIDRGGGGAVFMFSDFGMIDPGSRPDVYSPGYFSASLSSVTAGQTLSVTFNLANDGSGSGGAFENRILLATNSSLTAGVVQLAVLPVPGGIIPNPGVVIGPNAVTIPAGTSPGSYWIGVRLDAGNALDEEDESNNVSATMITVIAPDGDVVDQVNDPPTGSSFSCGNPPIGSLYQGFTPSVARLAAVELRLREGGGFPAGGVTATVRIRAGSPGGAILGSAAVHLDPAGSGVQRLVRFGFDTPLTLTQGALYVIELASVAGPIFGWMGVNEGSSYPGGTVYGCTGVAGTWDLNFKTFSQVASGAADNTFNLTTRGTAVIDGIINEGEWTHSVCKTIVVNTPFGGTTPASLCVMNDATNFYTAIRYSRATPDPVNSLTIEIDGENSPYFKHDVYLFNGTSFFDDVRNYDGTAPDDVSIGGSNDGAGAVHVSGSTVMIELSHPLRSGDALDMQKAPGQQLRFVALTRIIAAGGTFPTGFGDTTWPGPGIFTYATVNLAP